MNIQILCRWTLCFSLPVLLIGCQNPIKKAVRNVEYSAYEMIGVQKRDLLKDRVKDAKNDQSKASEEFQDALQRLQAAYGSSNSKIETNYNALKSSYDRSQSRADEVHQSIKKVETVAGDLFEEWEKEIGQIETEGVRIQSEITALKKDMDRSIEASQKFIDQMESKAD